MTDIWTVQKILNWTTEFFTSKSIPESRLSTELLLADVLGCKRIDLYVQFERILTPEERASFRGYVQRRAAGEPVQYILGSTEFMGHPFIVNPGVLIPRPDTEVLVETVIEDLTSAGNAKTILDIGTGSGCIAISLKKQFPDAAVWAVDRSSSAIATAQKNIDLNDVKIDLVEGDFFELRSNEYPPFDCIVANPPYISEEDWPGLEKQVKEFEPREALWGGPGGMVFYQKLIPGLKSWLSNSGSIYLETGYDQAKQVASLLTDAGFNTKIKNDYQEIERVVVGALRPH